MACSYPACDHIRKPRMADINLSNEVSEAIGMDFRALPMFEKGIYEYKFKQNYTVFGNEFLKCRWIEYKKHIETRVFAPFEFLNIRDYHFYNCRNQLLPSESIFRKDDFRMKLRKGPGVDFRGQIPIPNESLMKRGA